MAMSVGFDREKAKGCACAYRRRVFVEKHGCEQFVELILSIVPLQVKSDKTMISSRTVIEFCRLIEELTQFQRSIAHHSLITKSVNAIVDFGVARDNTNSAPQIVINATSSDPALPH